MEWPPPVLLIQPRLTLTGMRECSESRESREPVTVAVQPEVNDTAPPSKMKQQRVPALPLRGNQALARDQKPSQPVAAVRVSRSR
jgi:hypothetical protein